VQSDALTGEVVRNEHPSNLKRGHIMLNENQNRGNREPSLPDSNQSNTNRNRPNCSIHPVSRFGISTPKIAINLD
jgi:hypothetical protein